MLANVLLDQCLITTSKQPGTGCWQCWSLALLNQMGHSSLCTQPKNSEELKNLYMPCTVVNVLTPCAIFRRVISPTASGAFALSFKTTKSSPFVTHSNTEIAKQLRKVSVYVSMLPDKCQWLSARDGVLCRCNAEYSCRIYMRDAYIGLLFMLAIIQLVQTQC